MLLEHAYADLGDVRLHYVTAGQGPAVVLLHGWPQTWYMWRDVMPGLATRYRVIAPDLRGLGDSSRPADGYDKKTLALDVWHLVHDVLREESLFVVGHDWGGPTAFALAAQHREAVRRVAIFDVPVPGDGTSVFFNNRWHHGFHWEPDLPEELTEYAIHLCILADVGEVDRGVDHVIHRKTRVLDRGFQVREGLPDLGWEGWR